MNTSKPSSRKVVFILAQALLFLILSIGCALSPAAAPTSTPTTPPTATPTDTSTPTSIPPTSTPLPTETPTPVPTDTPTPTATPNATGTAQAEASATASAAEALIQDDLKTAGVPFEAGKLVFLQDQPEDIYLSEYGEGRYQPINEDLIAKDFILKTDITWDSTSGLSICGLMLRANNDFNDTYIFKALRLSGIPAWDIQYYEDQYLQHSIFGGSKTSSLIDQTAGATNTYIIVAKGITFTTYANGKKIGLGETPKLSKGSFAYFAAQESGETTCTFSNTWIWELTGSK